MTDLTDSYTVGGILHIADGYYRVDFPDAAFVTGKDSVLCTLAAENMGGIGSDIHLVDYDPQSATDLGLSSVASCRSPSSRLFGVRVGAAFCALFLCGVFWCALFWVVVLFLTRRRIVFYIPLRLIWIALAIVFR